MVEARDQLNEDLKPFQKQRIFKQNKTLAENLRELRLELEELNRIIKEGRVSNGTGQG